MKMVYQTSNQSSHLLLSLREKCPNTEFFWSYFPAFRLNTERYGVSLRILIKTPIADWWLLFGAPNVVYLHGLQMSVAMHISVESIKPELEITGKVEF